MMLAQPRCHPASGIAAQKNALWFFECSPADFFFVAANES